MSGGAVRGLAEPVRILSDLHLGHPVSQLKSVEPLRPLLEGAATVVFNGDTCELTYEPWRPGAEDLLAQLRGLCRELGAQPVFLTGNHDPGIPGEGWLDLGSVFISHGDMIYPTSAPWSWEYLRNKKAVKQIVRDRRNGAHDPDLAYCYETVLKLHDAMVPEADVRKCTDGRRYLLSALWPPERLGNILRVWTTMVGNAERFVRRHRPEARAFLFGHFHRPGVWKRGGRIHCNTGSFMHGMSAMVAEIHGESLSVRRVKQSGNGLVSGAKAGEFSLLPSVMP